MKDNDREVQKLKKENVELRQNLQKIIEKEENDKRYRMEIEKVTEKLKTILLFYD